MAKAHALVHEPITWHLRTWSLHDSKTLHIHFSQTTLKGSGQGSGQMVLFVGEFRMYGM